MITSLFNSYNTNKAIKTIDKAFAEYTALADRIAKLYKSYFFGYETAPEYYEISTTFTMIKILLIEMKEATIAIDALVNHYSELYSIDSATLRKGRWGMFSDERDNIRNYITEKMELNHIVWIWYHTQLPANVDIPFTLLGDIPPCFISAFSFLTVNLDVQNINLGETEKLSNQCLLYKALHSHHPDNYDRDSRAFRKNVIQLIEVAAVRNFNWICLFVELDTLSTPALLLLYTYASTDPGYFSGDLFNPFVTNSPTIRLFNSSDSVNCYIDEIYEKTAIFLHTNHTQE